MLTYYNGFINRLDQKGHNVLIHLILETESNVQTF